jgi:hypothetical protein
MTETCATCGWWERDFWGPSDSRPDVGTCKRMEPQVAWLEYPNQKPRLRTKEKFGCNQWEGRESDL